MSRFTQRPSMRRFRQLRQTIERLDERCMLTCDLISGHALAAGDFDGDAALTANDIDLLSQAVRDGVDDSTFDVNRDGLVDDQDRNVWIKSVRGTYIGDSNLDGMFSTGDFVHVFQANRYETDLSASWAHGDWNGDGRFNTSDLVSAFQDQGFEEGLRPLVPTTVELLGEFDSGTKGDGYTSFGSVTLTGTTTPFSVLAVASGPVASADSEGQFFLNDVTLRQGGNSIELNVTGPNCSQDTAAITISRAMTSDPSPFGHFVTNRVLNPEYRTSFSTVFLIDGMTLDDFAATVADATDDDSDPPNPMQVRPVDGLQVSELEAPTTSGENDTFATSQPIVGLGTDDGENSYATVQGALFPNPIVIETSEDDGDINKATDITDALSSRGAVIAHETIGDGPHGSASGGTGDFDFYAIRNVAKDEVITIDINTPFDSTLDSFILVYDSSGELVDANDNDLVSTDSFIRFTVPEDGDYFVSVAGFGSFGPVDPFDSSSGFGADSEGDYEIRFRVDLENDVDMFSFEMSEGDVFGASVYNGAEQVTLYDADGRLLVSTSIDASSIYADESPLPRGGNASIGWVSSAPGTYYVAVDAGFGEYELDLGIFRPALESASRNEHQTLFLDFDGASLNAEELFGFGNTDASLTPMAEFLDQWGLSKQDEDAVIDAIVATVQENFDDIAARGNNGNREEDGIDGNFQVEIVTSRDVTNSNGFPRDLFGEPNVSRVVIGGTIRELGIATIGIAESIDVGNFDTTESSVVLLDHLSGSESNINSLNHYPRAEGVSIIDLIGVAVGNIVTHEAGHFFGAWHTDNRNASVNLMDQGGNLANTIGLGDDGIFGTGDDVDADFGVDDYTDRELFDGVEDTLNALAFGLSSGTAATDMQVIGTQPTLGEVTSTPINELIISFGDAIEALGPAAALSVNGIQADAIEQLGESSVIYRFDASPVTTQGVQAVSLQPGGVTRADGGESVGYEYDFGFDELMTAAVAITPASGELVSLPLTEIVVTFNESINPLSVGTDDLAISQGEVAEYSIVNDTTVRYSLSNVVDEHEINVRLLDGAVTDAYGNFAKG
ncbi:MAG: PPC domain-containing protein, partial [Planctomycetales bacterium]|nr:PPC domain-containing protein [Planctomycetales bacterium]